MNVIEGNNCYSPFRYTGFVIITVQVNWGKTEWR